MAPHLEFKKLNHSSRHVLSFAQKDYVPLVDKANPAGECLPIAMQWIKTKLRGSNKGTHKLTELFSWDPSNFKTAKLARRGARTAAATATVENAVKTWGGDNPSDTSLKGIEARLNTLPTSPRLYPPDVDAVMALPVSLGLLRAARDLPGGHALLFGVRVGRPGTLQGVIIHAVAMYKSRGNTLYFFDPNCGVYEVKIPLLFFRQWRDSCVAAFSKGQANFDMHWHPIAPSNVNGPFRHYL